MTYIICCKKCSEATPAKILDAWYDNKKDGQKLMFKMIPNHGIFYCPHVKVFERVTVSKWKNKQ